MRTLDAPSETTSEDEQGRWGAPRSWAAALRGGAIAAVGVVAFALLVRPALVARVASGEPLPVVDRPLPSFGPASPEELVTRVLVTLGGLAVVAAVAAVRWPGGWRRLVLRPAAATDLAVLRIGVFGLALVLPRVPEAVRLSGFPAEVRVPPAVTPWLLDVVPTSPTTVRPLAVVFLVACALACVGWWTRPAMIVAAVVGVYLLGIPQFHGKVTHYHHLWWAMAVLAASPAGHAVSFDAVRRGWRDPDGVRSRDLHGVRYGAPLRLLWLLLGLVYLFPGVWKFASAGWDWALSDNLRFVLYEHWSRLGQAPAFPIDRTLFVEAAGLGTLAFELGFVVFVLHGTTRPWLAGTGLVFHNVNGWLLGLRFATLQVLYLSFVPWHRLATAFGRRRAALDVTVAADAPRARRLVGATDVADPFGGTAVTVATAGDPAAAGRVPPVLADGTDETPRRVARRLVARSPLTWPLWPLLVVTSDARFARWAAGGRPAGPPPPPEAGRATRPVAALVVGVTLLVGNLGVGLLAIGAAWPVASYPAFNGIHAETVTRLSLAVTDADGDEVVLASEELRDLVSWEKYDGLARPLLRDDPDPERLAGLLTILADEGVDLPEDGTVTLLRDTQRLTREGGVLVEREARSTWPLPVAG